MTAIAEGIYWPLPRNADPAAELDRAAERFRERTGRDAELCQVHPSGLFEHPRFRVEPDGRVLRGQLFVGVGADRAVPVS